MKRFLLLVVLGLFCAGCGGPLMFNPPASLNYTDHTKTMPMTVGIYIPPDIKAQKFNPCEKLMFGSTQCYTGDIGSILETNAVAAYSKGFSNVVVLSSPNDFNEVDAAVQIAYVSEELNTTLEGPVAYRSVTLTLEQKFLHPASLASASPVIYKSQTDCEAWKCRVDGVETGMEGYEVVLKQLFLPGFAFSGYGKALANIVNTAFCASLKEALENSVLDLKKSVATL